MRQPCEPHPREPDLNRSIRGNCGEFVYVDQARIQAWVAILESRGNQQGHESIGR